jgi:hypothetical protein
LSTCANPYWRKRYQTESESEMYVCGVVMEICMV